ncbi:MAG: GGDEF domain-containing protein [Desulfovibrio sp.]|jgi:diguanylate cyclase (GGDEF)-like protein|nr:GGDEF domain-containing protein [Desulfovibrio sp.]
MKKNEWTYSAASQQHFRHFSANRLLLLLLLPGIVLFLLIIGVTIYNLLAIESGADTLLRENIPAMMENRRSADNLAVLRHEIDTIYATTDAERRHRSTLTAEMILANFVFEQSDDMRKFADKFYSLPRQLSEVRAKRLYNDDKLEALQLYLSGMSALLRNEAEAPLSAMDQNDALIKPTPARKFARAHDLCLRTDLPRDLREPCAVFQQTLQAAEETYAEITAADKTAALLRQGLSDELLALDAALAASAVQNTHAKVGKIKDDSQTLANMFRAMPALLLLCLLGILAILRIHFLTPIAKLTGALDEIARGHYTLPNLPYTRIYELQKIMDQLPRICRNLKKLTSLTERLAHEKRKFEDLSMVDGLTGVSNRRSFDMRLARKEKSHRGESLAILMIDVDKFKDYNDHLGHQAGDKCLTFVAHAMKSVLLRRNDTLYRYGGEEFTVILENVSADQAMAIAMRIREAVYKLRLPHPASPASPYVTVSVGVSAVHREHQVSCTEVVEQADRALLVAKSRGRNRIHLYYEADFPTRTPTQQPDGDQTMPPAARPD